ncbi:MAG TPA: KpsF/GutQ family sugar-phosphate isomerase [Acidobacteriota bacterium]|nr:KpsF/GutQ family sugar-phosphate isomerase [Acidobacteriota bacterium]
MQEPDLDLARRILEIEADAIRRLAGRLGPDFESAVELLASTQGRVVTSGMGKSGIICRKIAATLSSTGTPSLFLHPAEAVHGDLGMLARGDTVLVVSNSGETQELIRLLNTIKRLGLPLIAMVGNLQSTLAAHADVVLDISVDREACLFGLAPTASTTAALALGDSLAMVLSRKKGFRLEEFARLHPGGKLGKRLAKVQDLMHVGDSIPRVSRETPMDEVIYEMSRKGLGITAVTDDGGRLVGVISDGDLRRLLQRDREGLLQRTAEQCMTPNPVTIPPAEMAAKALDLLERRKITSLMVVDETARLIGVLHLHDLWGTELF